MADFSLPGYVAAGSILAAFLGLACMAVASTNGRWLALPGAIALAEYARGSFPFGGIPLSTLAMSQVGSPLAPVARIGGGLLLSLLTVLIGAGLSAVLQRRWLPALVAAGVVAVALSATSVIPTSRTVAQLGGHCRIPVIARR